MGSWKWAPQESGKLRLLRLLRVLKLVKALPDLAVIVQALTAGLSSIGFISLIVIGVFCE